MAIPTGPQHVVKNEIAEYHVDAIPGETYSWSVSKGTILSGQDTASIVVQWTDTGDGQVNVTTSRPGFPPVEDGITIIIDPNVG